MLQHAHQQMTSANDRLAAANQQLEREVEDRTLAEAELARNRDQLQDLITERTAELVPLCHPLPLTRVAVDFALDADTNAVRCTVTAETVGRTGVEMEALTAVQIALLTIYDMCKALDKAMLMTDIALVHKSGGKSGQWDR